MDLAPDALSPSNMFAGVLFGCIGLAAWQIGRKRESPRAMVLGVVLMVFTFAVPPGFWTWVVGIALSVFCFWP